MVPMGNVKGIPVEYQLVDPLCKKLPGLLLEPLYFSDLNLQPFSTLLSGPNSWRGGERKKWKDLAAYGIICLLPAHWGQRVLDCEPHEGWCLHATRRHPHKHAGMPPVDATTKVSVGSPLPLHDDGYIRVPIWWSTITAQTWLIHHHAGTVVLAVVWEFFINPIRWCVNGMPTSELIWTILISIPSCRTTPRFHVNLYICNIYRELSDTHFNI